MIIRQLELKDIENHFASLYELKCRSLRMNFRDVDCNNLEEICKAKVLELQGYIKEGKAVVFGAFKNDRLIAFLWAYPRFFFNQPRMFINGICVEEAWEGHGVAKKLVHLLKNYAVEHGCAALDLTVAPFNEKAIGFYHHLGFADERIQMALPLKMEKQKKQ